MRSPVAVALVLVAVATARAESPADREAHAHYTAAQKLFDAAAYARALDEFEQAYALSHYPAILHKIALCRDQLGQVEPAIEAYRRYLEADPSSPRRPGIEQRIEQLQALTSPAAPPVDKAPPPVEKSAPPVSPAPVDKAPAPAIVIAAPAEAPPPAHKPAYKKWWLWTLVGVGAAGLAVGLGVGLSSPRSPTPDSFMPTLGRIGPGR